MTNPPRDISIVKLFFTDLKNQAGTFLIEINALKESPKQAINKLIKLIRDIRAASIIVNQESLGKLVTSLESYLMHFKDQNTAFQDEDIEKLKGIGKLLEKIAQNEAENSYDKEIKESTDFFNESTFSDKESSGDTSMLELFQNELENQTRVLNEGLVQSEHSGYTSMDLEVLMRAAHSIKGAAKVVNLDAIVHLAHAMEDCFTGVMHNEIDFEEEDIEILFQAIDMLTKISRLTKPILKSWINQERPVIEEIVKQLSQVKKKNKTNEKSEKKSLPEIEHVIKKVINPEKEVASHKEPHRMLRVTAQNLNRLMGLAGESMVESRWLQPFSESLVKLKKNQNELSNLVDQLRESLDKTPTTEVTQTSLVNLQHKTNECRQSLTERLTELELFISRHSSLTDRLYSEVIDSRMRPFGDGVLGFPRMVRDIAKELNKKVHLNILGKSTPVDRDILEKLETPLSHLIRNCIDHGIETPEERAVAGKPPEGLITIEAHHRAGMLAITVSDDGRGIDLEKLKKVIIEKGLAKKNFADKLTSTEILDFLFLPGFSTAKKITEISGRGMGLNIVQNMVQEVVGSVRIETSLGKGSVFNLNLPLTLSVIRAMIVEIAGETYAFPLARIDQAMFVPQKDIHIIENRQYFNFLGQNIGLVPATQVLGLNDLPPTGITFPVIILSDRSNSYGVVVDRYMGERELVVQEMDARLGKVPNILSGAFMEDGTPILIIDVEDMVRSIDLLLSGGRLHNLKYVKETATLVRAKRILVVDDSITVREVECRLLRNKGYDVETAVNGMDGWNAVRLGHYDLIITDVDMPRMNGIELVKAIKNDPRLRTLPVMIVSYKERESDRLAGLEAGANYYLTKSSFHDETLLDAVNDLIGKP